VGLVAVVKSGFDLEPSTFMAHGGNVVFAGLQVAFTRLPMVSYHFQVWKEGSGWGGAGCCLGATGMVCAAWCSFAEEGQAEQGHMLIVWHMWSVPCLKSSPVKLSLQQPVPAALHCLAPPHLPAAAAGVWLPLPGVPVDIWRHHRRLEVWPGLESCKTCGRLHPAALSLLPDVPDLVSLLGRGVQWAVGMAGMC
jgi:hypothetical protein